MRLPWTLLWGFSALRIYVRKNIDTTGRGCYSNQRKETDISQNSQNMLDKYMLNKYFVFTMGI